MHAKMASDFYPDFLKRSDHLRRPFKERTGDQFHLIYQRRQHRQKQKNRGEMFFSVAIVVLQLVPAIFQTIKRILDLPPAATGPRYVLNIGVIDFPIRDPRKNRRLFTRSLDFAP